MTSVLRLLAALGVASVVLEGASWVALGALDARPELPYAEMYATSSCLKANDFNYGRFAHSPQHNEVMLRRVPHPSFGFTINPGIADASERTVTARYEEELRYRLMLGADPRPPGTYTIGVFGASVAGGFYNYVEEHPEFVARLQAEIPALRDKHVVLRDMTIGSSRQPAQLAVATQYADLLDMTINLDGYSEVAVIQYPEFPIEFPMFAEVFYAGEGPSTYLPLLAAEAVCHQISSVPDLFPPLRYSSFYYLFWRSVSRWLNATMYEPTPMAEQRSVQATPFTPEEVRRLYAEYYRRYTGYQHQVLTAGGVRAYFFLQPNQYASSSKTFSAQELEVALGYGDAQEITARYELLRGAVASLRAAGVPAFDLTRIYTDVADTIYIDNCCHVNDLGNRIIADHIADAIIREENARTGPL